MAGLDWQRVESLYHNAAALPAAEWAPYLDSHCGAADTEIRHEVEELLAARQQSDGFLDRPALEDGRWLRSDAAAGRDWGRQVRRVGADPTAPEQLGNYRILRELGRGGTGIVYLAEDLLLGRKVAVKVLAPAGWAEPLRRRHFVEEACLLASVRDPNVAAVHSLEQAGGVLLIVMEWVDGETLEEKLAGAALSVAAAVSVGGQIAAALGAMHAAGVLHCDLKGSNVRIANNGRVKVLDFGLARSAERRTAVGGTPGSMSPEQRRGADLDERSDLWAFGLLLRHCLTGTKGVSPWPAAVPPALVDVVESCLAHDPEDRPATIDAVQTVLRSVQKQCGDDEPVAAAVPLPTDTAVSEDGGPVLQLRLAARAHELEAALGIAPCARRAAATEEALAALWESATPAEQQLLARLSTFAGSWTHASLQVVAAAEDDPQWEPLHAAFVDRGWVEVTIAPHEFGGEARMWLVPALRERARAALEASGAHTAVDRRHLHYFAAVVEPFDADLHATPSAEYEQLDRDNEELLTVLARPFDDPHDVATQLRIASGLGRYWMLRGQWHVAAEHLQRLLELPQAQEASLVRGRALRSLCALTMRGGSAATALHLAEESLRVLATLGAETERAKVLINLGGISKSLGRFDDAQQQYAEGLALTQSHADAAHLGTYFHQNLADLAVTTGDLDAAERHYEEQLRALRDEELEAHRSRVHHGLGIVWWKRGDHAAARMRFEKAAEMARRAADRRGLAATLACLAILAEEQGSLDHARMLHQQSLDMRREIGDVSGIASSEANLGNIAHQLGDFTKALPLHLSALAARRRNADVAAVARSLGEVAAVQRDLRDFAAAYVALRECLEICRDAAEPDTVLRALEVAGTLALTAGQRERGARLLHAAQRYAEDAQHPLSPSVQREVDRYLRRFSIGESSQATPEVSTLEVAIQEAWRVIHDADGPDVDNPDVDDLELDSDRRVDSDSDDTITDSSETDHT
ncbi:MAG: serine/threonine-protein kinase [Planctomycetota bacterium]